MSIASLRAPLLCLILFTLSPFVAAADDQRMACAEAFENLLNGAGEAAHADFIDRFVSAEYREELGEDGLREHLQKICKQCINPGGVALTADGVYGLTIMIENQRGTWDVHFERSSKAPHGITKLSTEALAPREALPALTWDTLESRMRGFEKDGFSGSLIMLHKGKVVLDKGYGFADKAKGVRNTPDTIFAMGSNPIDFTRAAILLLEDAGMLSSSDRIAEYIDGVPHDKELITIAHLIHGRSGLRNFHGRPDVDIDRDLFYIDRDEAMRRIMEQPLLFAPGTQNAHSHSAWGVLAAIVEIVSEQSYGEFLQENLFEPAGMTRTGLYPHAMQFDDKQVAVGNGQPALGQPNTPKNWGETSWLVMGSGGMVTTTRDMLTYMQAMRAGKILSPKAESKYWRHSVNAGDNDRGFLMLYTEGPATQVIFCCNSNGRGEHGPEDISRVLADLVLSSR